MAYRLISIRSLTSMRLPGSWKDQKRRGWCTSVEEYQKILSSRPRLSQTCIMQARKAMHMPSSIPPMPLTGEDSLDAHSRRQSPGAKRRPMHRGSSVFVMQLLHFHSLPRVSSHERSGELRTNSFFLRNAVSLSHQGPKVLLSDHSK